LGGVSRADFKFNQRIRMEIHDQARKDLLAEAARFRLHPITFYFFGVFMRQTFPRAPFLRVLAILLALSCVFVISGCEKEAAVTVKTLSVPSTDQDSEWKEFVNEVAKSKRIKGKTKGIYVRFLGTTEDTKGHLRDTIQSFSRGIAPGSLLVFGSYNSRNMADLLVEAFETEYIDGKLNGARLVFVGQRADEARVKAASIKSGVTFEFYPVD
jgi:hypothetical protein